jgi:hypothetical protein
VLTKRIHWQKQTRGCRPSEVKGLRFAPIPSGLSPLTSFTPLISRGCAVFSENSPFYFGGTGSRNPCNGSVVPVERLLEGERYLVPLKPPASQNGVVTFFHYPLGMVWFQTRNTVFCRTEYRVLQDGIPCFAGRNTVFCRTEYRVLQDGIPCFAGRN